MKKVQIFIESDIIVRHFLHNDTFDLLKNEFIVQFVFPNDSRVSTPIESLNLNNVKIIDVNRPRLGKMRELIKAYGLRRIRNNPKFAFLEDQWRGLLPKKSFFRIKLFSNRFIFPLYKWITLRNLGNYPEMEKVIYEFDPDIVLHPCVLEGLFISDLVSITKKNNIPFIVLMNSWDNPSTKATVLGLPKKLVVWGEQTKQHAIEFMGMPKDDIEIFGPAQFEVYKSPPQKSRKDYCEEANIDPEKTLIIYAGSSKSINEIEHLQTLEKAIGSGHLENAHIVFKPHPWRAAPEDEEDFFDLSWNHISMDPGMIPFYKRSVEKNDNSIQLSSYMDTHNILSACDILISNVSTILLEAALHGMPVMCMVSDKELQENNFVRVTLNSLYFCELMEKLSITRCTDHSEIVQKCQHLLKLHGTQNFYDEQIQKTEFFVEMKGGSYAQKLLNLVNNTI